MSAQGLQSVKLFVITAQYLLVRQPEAKRTLEFEAANIGLAGMNFAPSIPGGERTRIHVLPLPKALVHLQQHLTNPAS
jgi:hypothetical protein